MGQQHLGLSLPFTPEAEVLGAAMQQYFCQFPVPAVPPCLGHPQLQVLSVCSGTPILQPLGTLLRICLNTALTISKSPELQQGVISTCYADTHLPSQKCQNHT